MQGSLIHQLRHDTALCMHAGDLTTNYFKLNSGLNGGSVWQNDCRKITHSGSRFDNNTAERGSAGIEMNQVTSAEIRSCTFTTGKGAKGSGLYLQASPSYKFTPLPALVTECGM